MQKTNTNDQKNTTQKKWHKKHTHKKIILIHDRVQIKHNVQKFGVSNIYFMFMNEVTYAH